MAGILFSKPLECMNQDFIIKVLKFILQNKYFIFDDSHYRKKCGIVMGTKAAPVLRI